MADFYKLIKLKKSDSLGFGFSILGGAGTELPPIIYDIVAGSPAANAPQLSTGDVIVEVNGEDVQSFTTREVLTSLRKSTREVILKLKSDATLQAKVKQLLQSPDDITALKGAISKNDLHGFQQILAKKKLKSGTTIRNGDSAINNNLDVKSPLEDVNNATATGKQSEPKVLAGDDSFQNVQSSHGFPSFSMKESEFIKMYGSLSVPSSPCTNEQVDMASTHFTMEQTTGLGSPACSTNSLTNGPYLYPSSCGTVRISKSEDHLQDDNLENTNIDLDDATASLNTLLDIGSDPADLCRNPHASDTSHNNDNAKTVWSCVAPLSSPESSLHYSHDSDSPLIQSLVSPQSPTSSMQYSSSPVYNKITNNLDSQCSSNRSALLSNTSSFTSPDTDVPDELDWDDTTPTFTNSPINGFVDMLSETPVLPASTTNHLPRENVADKVDENRIIIKVAGAKKEKHYQVPYIRELHRSNCEADKSCIQVSETVSADTLAYQELSESEDETTCFSEKSDRAGHMGGVKANTSAPMMSPTMSEDESDIDSLHSFHFSPKAVDLPSAVRLAKRLHVLDGFKKSDVSRHLSKNNEFNKIVAEEYLNHFDFKDDTLDVALRKFLDRFCLTGETQERERVLVHFSKRFLDCNPGTFNSQDSVHTLTCAIMLLNTDLHASNIGRKMSANEFIDNLADLNDGENFPKEVLKSLYQSIRNEPLKWAVDEYQSDDLDLKNKVVSVFDNSLGSNPFLSVPNGNGVIYKKGYVMRKSCFEPHGKRTPFGKRSWKMYFCVIQDLVLYLHKDEQGARRDPTPQYGQNSIRLHHASAARAHDYCKKEHVFRLLTADQAEYLLQTSDSKELQVWIDAINFVAASLSTPPMAGAVGSQKKFQRPLLPCSVTKLSLIDQLQDHKIRLENLEKDCDAHANYQLDKNAKSSTISSFKEKEAYLNSEIKRYQTYVYLLQSKLDSSAESAANAGPVNIEMTELPVFEARKNDVTNGLEIDASSGIVPPPIPSRTRPSDSGGKLKNIKDVKPPENVESAQQSMEGSKTTDSMQPERPDNSKHVKARRRFSLRKVSLHDEFQNELHKMIKEKAKREKKAQEKAEKQLKKSQPKTDPGKSLSTEEAPEDPRVGTFNRMSALFKFKKLNKSPELLLEEDAEKQSPIEEVSAHQNIPPPLPPKPPANSAIHINIGTKINI